MRRFFGTVEIDPSRPIRSFETVINAVAELQRTPGAKLTLTLDIEAVAEQGFEESDVDVVFGKWAPVEVQAWVDRVWEVAGSRWSETASDRTIDIARSACVLIGSRIHRTLCRLHARGEFARNQSSSDQCGILRVSFEVLDFPFEVEGDAS